MDRFDFIRRQAAIIEAELVDLACQPESRGFPADPPGLLVGERARERVARDTHRLRLAVKIDLDSGGLPTAIVSHRYVAPAISGMPALSSRAGHHFDRVFGGAVDQIDSGFVLVPDNLQPPCIGAGPHLRDEILCVGALELASTTRS